MKHDYKMVTDGTDNHLNLWDLRPLNLTGSKVEKVCDLAHITLNKVRVHLCCFRGGCDVEKNYRMPWLVTLQLLHPVVFESVHQL